MITAFAGTGSNGVWPKSHRKRLRLVRHPTPQAENPGRNHEKSCFSMFFSMNPWPKPFKTVPAIEPDHFAPVWTSPDHSQPIVQLLPIFIFLHIFPTPAPTLATPCFLFLEGISPQDLKIRIKHRELVLKAARISNFITSAPHWCKIKQTIRQNRDVLDVHC